MEHRPEVRPDMPTHSQKPSAELVAVRVILNASYRERDEMQNAFEEASWLRVLRGFDADDILAGWERYQANGPRLPDGGLKKPSAHCIAQRCSKIRHDRTARTALPPPPEAPAGPRVTSEQAQRIIEEAGFTPDLARALKRFPGAPSRSDAMELSEQPPEKQMTFETDADRLRRAREAARERGAV